MSRRHGEPARTVHARARGLWVLLAAVAACLIARQASAGDPRARWFTVRTPHYAVHYHSGLEDLAQRTATFCETTRTRLSAPLGFAPTGITHVLLTDGTDSANGSAGAIPYNALRLFVTAPEDLSVLGDFDDWSLSLITHEQAHILHVDNISGAAVLVNAVLGKTYSPNQVQPRWILEGLAVAMESRLTSAGRIRSSLFDMYLRADVLSDHVVRLDELSHSVRRWPGGDIWYLYGGKFIDFILETYGEDTFAAVSADYGANLFPWGLNRSMERATGRTYPELYDAWLVTLREKYARQVAEVGRRGRREGTRLTTGGRAAGSPRFVPACARAGKREELLYYRDDGDTEPGFYRLPLTSRVRADEGDLELVARTTGSARSASFDAECGIVFDAVAESRFSYGYDDLHRAPVGPAEGPARRTARERWTHGLRARSPDMSPNGERVTFVKNHAGTTHLRIAEVRPEGGIGPDRPLIASGLYEQAFSPRFSPDGSLVAYAAWTRGGYRDIRVVDVESGTFREVTRDRAQDGQPSFSPDGRRVYFASDRTGISNVYAYDLPTGRLFQVTNVVTGAFMPEISPDGRTLVYVGYTADGFDLYSMPVDERRFLPALPYQDDRPMAHGEPDPVRWPVEPYDPLPTLRPHSYEIDSLPGAFGDMLVFRVGGSDMTGRHGLSGSLEYHQEIGEFTGSAGYSFGGLPFGFSASAFRALSPRMPLVVAGREFPVREEILGVTTSVGHAHGKDDEVHSVQFSYTASAHDTHYPIGENIDPFADVGGRPRDFFLGSVRAGWSYSTGFRPANGVTVERGLSIAVGTDYAGRETGSEATLTSIDARIIGHALAPWGGHHTFALALSGGAAAGSFPGRGFYFTGGYTEVDIVESIRTGIAQGPFVLRGYPPAAFIGRQFNLANLEYRFPIADVERGISTLPLFFNGVSGALFADYGGAYDLLDLRDPLGQYHLGVGGELRLSMTFGYFLESSARLGWARGFGEKAFEGGTTYLVAAFAF